MTISSDALRKAGPYACNSVQVIFVFSFKIFSTADLNVVISNGTTETTLALDTNYTVSMNSDQNVNPGGTITTVAVYSASFALTIGSAVKATQTTSIPNQSSFHAVVVETIADKATSLVLDDRVTLARSIRAPLSDVAPLADLPPAAVRASRQFYFDAAGQPAAGSSTAGATVSTAMQPVVESATLAAARAAMGVGSGSGSEWTALGLTPTFVTATSFTVTGNQTSALHVGRRLKTTNTGGTIYSTVTNSVFGAVTTVTVVNDSGVLDAGLSVINYGIISAVNSSWPINEWIALGLSPTYVSNTSFTVAGDQTSTLHIGRRLKTTNGSGTIYSTIANSVFGAVTTVTVVNDFGPLTAGLSAINYGIISAVDSSWPIGLTTVEYLTSGTANIYVTQLNARALNVELWGPGGGSGGVAGLAGGAAISGPGGGGAYVNVVINAPSPTYLYTVGLGGAFGPSGNNAGQAGTTTNFSGITALSGAGGAGMLGTTGSISSGGAPGGATSYNGISNLILAGGSAGCKSVIGGALACIPTSGGAPFIGSGTAGNVTGAGFDGVIYGAGGGCASTNNATSYPGAIGARGLIKITTYF